jgi:UPF0716 protein FxsA
MQRTSSFSPEGRFVFARLLFLLFTLLPVVEIALLVWIGMQTSVLFVLGLVIGTGILGAGLARYQGLQTLRRISADLESGRMPGESLVDGLLVLLAAFLLILPGVLSDLVAIALLFPPTRWALKGFVRRRLQARMVAIRYGRAGFDADQIIDVRVVESPPRQLPQ